jgi:hypothetical protein
MLTPRARARTPVPVAVVVLLLVATLGLAACSGGGGDGGAGDASSSSTPSSTTPAAPVTTLAGASDCAGFRGSTTSLTSSGPTAPGFLIDATAGAQGCLDVVTLTFQTRGDGTPPGYVVRYRDVSKEPFTEAPQPTEATQPAEGNSSEGDSSGGDSSTETAPTETEPPDTEPPAVIDVPGAAHLQVSSGPASSVDATDPANPQQTYTGNLSLEYGAHNHLVVVRELPDTKDAAGQDTVNWVIGLDSVRPFRVDRAENPTRITILIG